MKRALLTGGTGFIGKRLARALVARGYAVRCLVRDSYRARSLLPCEVELAVGDIARPDTLEGIAQDCQTVFHLAGITHAADRSEYFRANALGVGHLAQACVRESRPPVLVYTSSLSAVGPARRRAPLQESDRPVPVSYYGQGKRGGERILEQLADRLPITIVRPGVVFGPEDRSLFPLFQAAARFHCHPMAGLLPGRVSLLYVDDLIELLLAAAEKGARLTPVCNNGNHNGQGNGDSNGKSNGHSNGNRNGHASIVASDHAGQGYYFAAAAEQPSGLELGRMISRALGQGVSFPLFVPPLVLGTIALATEMVSWFRGRSEVFSLDKVQDVLAGDWIASTAAAVRDLDFAPAADLQTRLSETARWYRENGWL